MRQSRPTDDWVWLEGLKPYSDGQLAWWSLYCWHEKDISKANETLRRIENMKNLGHRLPDELDDFSEFRIRLPGEYSDAIDSIEEIRNSPAGWALLKVMNQYFPKCGKIHTLTAGVCQRPANHGKDIRHSSSVLAT